ncbi:MAG: hypothetical protein COY40_01695 [Alphaproteobacteria bacterium CG_4_10_14_0_8_um_filter_53_9]|nr:MAG: hypothetical protein COY40_01695 [Alphaproteobacteria bacterium CG_4_10_14_0_8_um_filter_53_9]
MPKIPDHASRVFKGVIFDIYQWEQELFDGTTAVFEMAKRPNTVVVMPMDGENIYYSHQEQPGKKPFYGLFGGRAEDGEAPMEAAQRELFEESGLVSDDWTLWRTVNSGSKLDWTVDYFIAKNCRVEGEQSLDSGEKISVHKMNFDDFCRQIVPQTNFAEYELAQYLMTASAPLPEAILSLKKAVM